MSKRTKIELKIKMDLLGIVSGRLHDTVEDMYILNKVPEICEVIVLLCIKDIASSRELDENSLDIDHYTDATKLGIAYLEMLSNQIKH